MSIGGDISINMSSDLDSLKDGKRDGDIAQKVPGLPDDTATNEKENSGENGDPKAEAESSKILEDDSMEGEVEGKSEKKEEAEDVVELQSNEFEQDMFGSQETSKKGEAPQPPKIEKKPEPTKKATGPPKIESRNFSKDNEKVKQDKRVWNTGKRPKPLDFEVVKDLIDITLKPNDIIPVERSKKRSSHDHGTWSSRANTTGRRGAEDEDNLDYEAESESDNMEGGGGEGVQKDPTAFPDPPLEPVGRSRKEDNRALLITNLIRPFTVLQLKTMLSHCGKVKSIWINTIKSRCYAVFSCLEEATRARETLHGAVWPSTSPKRLNVDYAEDERMYSETDGELIGDSIDITVIEEKKRKKPKREKEKKDTVEEGNKLDELFKKTVAVPSIYWLPLTEDKAKEREEERSKQKPKYFNPEPDHDTEYQKPRAVPRWKTPDRSRRRH